MKITYMTDTQKNDLYRNIYNRCYNPNNHKYKPCYKGCTICDEWYSEPGAEDQTGRLNFYRWLDEDNFYVIDGEPTTELDHNILKRGNTVYSPECCIFVPKSINSMFAGFAKKSDNDLPQGVMRAANGRYITVIKSIRDTFTTPEEAHAVWAEMQKMRIVQAAERYDGLIPQRLTDALLNWEFD